MSFMRCFGCSTNFAAISLFLYEGKKQNLKKKSQCTRIDIETRPTEYLLIPIIEAEKQPIWVENEKKKWN